MDEFLLQVRELHRPTDMVEVKAEQSAVPDEPVVLTAGEGPREADEVEVFLLELPDLLRVPLPRGDLLEDIPQLLGARKRVHVCGDVLVSLHDSPNGVALHRGGGGGIKLEQML